MNNDSPRYTALHMRAIYFHRTVAASLTNCIVSFARKYLKACKFSLLDHAAVTDDINYMSSQGGLIEQCLMISYVQGPGAACVGNSHLFVLLEPCAGEAEHISSSR